MSDNLPAGVSDDDIDRSQGYDARAEARERREIAAEREYERRRNEPRQTWFREVREQDEPRLTWFREVREQANLQASAPELHGKITLANAGDEIGAYADDVVTTLRDDSDNASKRREVVQLMAACLRVLDVLDESDE